MNDEHRSEGKGQTFLPTNIDVTPLVDALMEQLRPLLRPDPEPWIGVAEAAAHIGRPKSRIYELVTQGAIPHARDGRTLLFRRGDLDRWLERSKSRSPGHPPEQYPEGSGPLGF